MLHAKWQRTRFGAKTTRTWNVPRSNLVIPQIHKNIVRHTAHTIVSWLTNIDLADDMLVKRAYNEALKLHEHGFTTWVSKVLDIANKYEINLDNINLPSRNAIKQLVTEHFKNHWKSSIVHIASNHILRTYKLFITDFKFETYLDVVKDNRYRLALIKFQTSSHSLEIERGQYHNTDVKERLCPYCMRIDDEKYFILNCDAIVHERQCLFNKIRIRCPIFFDLDDLQKFQFLMMSDDHKYWPGWQSSSIMISIKEMISIEKPMYVASTTLYVMSIYIYELLHDVLCTALFIKTFLHVNSRKMYLICMWRFAVVFLHMYLWCVLCSFYCFILWLLCQKWRNKRAYILTHWGYCSLALSSRCKGVWIWL